MTYKITNLQPLKVEGASYTRFLRHLQKQGVIEVEYIEFMFAVQLRKILRGREKSPVWRVLRNIYRILRLLVTKDRVVLIGAAPNSMIILVLNWLKKRHKCIFHSSWPYWDGEDYERAELWFLPSQKKAWHRFLNGITSVGVTNAVCESVARYGADAIFIPHNVDTELFQPGVPRPDANPVRILFVGYLLKTKGIGVIADVIRSYDWNNVEFWFVGRGRCRKDIENLVAEGYPVRYIGYVGGEQKMVSIYQQCDVLIAPSIKKGMSEEKFGIVLIEAMACQLPVITTDCVGPREVVVDGETGFVIKQDDKESLRDAILKFVSSPDLRAEFGRKGRERAVEVYDLKKAARDWKGVIEKTHA